MASIAGVELDDWQADDLMLSMAVDGEERWRFTSVCWAVSRQNGKGEGLQARELMGAIRLGDVILHTAHHMGTSSRAFQRLEQTVSGSDLEDFSVKMRYANGEQAAEFLDGCGVFYRARSGKAGRGLDAMTVVVFDEAQHLTREAMAASTPTLAVSEHAQRWFLGSAGLSDSVVWHDLRRQGLIAADAGRGEPMTGRIVGEAGRMLWIEYTAEVITVNGDEIDIVRPDPEDRDAWARANPAYPHRITPEFLEDQLRVLGPEKFSREHLGVWDPLPQAVGASGSKIAADDWAATVDEAAEIRNGLVLAVACDWELGAAAVAAAGHTGDGRRLVEVVETGAGTEWLEAALTRLVAKHRPGFVAFDGAGPSRALRPAVERVCESAGRTQAKMISGADYAAGCDAFVSAVSGRNVTHLGTADLSTAVLRANVRQYGSDRWVWDLNGDVDVTPLAAVTVADWVASSQPERVSAYETHDGVMLV